MRTSSIYSLLLFLLPLLLLIKYLFSMNTDENKKYDVVIILGGGLTDNGSPHPFVEERIRVGSEFLSDTRYFILSSRGTPHKPPPRNNADFPIDESISSAVFLSKLLPDINPETILLDQWSLDTIGNAWFALVSFIEPMQLSNVLVVTSNFHMPRSEAVFRHIFSLSSTTINVHFVSSDDVGIDEEVLTLRQTKEAKSLQNWLNTMKICTTKQKMAHFLFVEHGAYNGRSAVKSIDDNCGRSTTAEDEQLKASLKKSY
jgi:uncharacterized SAM-binding protein YcdF (DUF218 family)